MAASREWVVLRDEVEQLFRELKEIREPDGVRELGDIREFGGINLMNVPQNITIRDVEAQEKVETQEKVVAQIEKIFLFLEREAYNHQAEFKIEIQHTTIFDRLLNELCTFPDQGVLQSLWKMENQTYDNVLQWLPAETLSDTISLYSPLSHALPDFLCRFSQLRAAFDITLMSDQEKFARLLGAAVEHDNRTLIDFLIDCGAKLDARTYHRTPLEAARAYDNKEMVKFLLDRGADPSKKSYEARHSELHPVIEMGWDVTTKFFVVTWVVSTFTALLADLTMRPQMVSDKTMDNVFSTEKAIKVMLFLLSNAYMIAKFGKSKELVARSLTDLVTQSLMVFDETMDNVSHFINNPLNSVRDNAVSIFQNPLNEPLDRVISPEIRLDVGRNVNSFFSRVFPNLGPRNNNENYRVFDRLIGDIVVGSFIAFMVMFFVYAEVFLKNDSYSPSPVPNPLAAARMN